MITHAGCHQIAAGRPRRTAGVHSTFAGRSEVSGGADPLPGSGLLANHERGEASAPIGRPTFPSVRAIVRDVRPVATGPGDVRDRYRGDDRQDAPARGHTRRQAEA